MGLLQLGNRPCFHQVAALLPHGMWQGPLHIAPHHCVNSRYRNARGVVCRRQAPVFALGQAAVLCPPWGRKYLCLGDGCGASLPGSHTSELLFVHLQLCPAQAQKQVPAALTWPTFHLSRLEAICLVVMLIGVAFQVVRAQIQSHCSLALWPWVHYFLLWWSVWEEHTPCMVAVRVEQIVAVMLSAWNLEQRQCWINDSYYYITFVRFCLSNLITLILGLWRHWIDFVIDFKHFCLTLWIFIFFPGTTTSS